MTYRERRKQAEKREQICKIILAIALLGVCLYCFWDGVQWENGKSSGYGIGFLVPTYSGQAFCVINDNVPFFTEEEKETDSFENYSELDSLGRCGPAFANVSRELMPKKDREEIGHIKPTGWKQAKYEGIVDSVPPYLYNRCHLIAFCLTGENDNEKNLITGTRYMNVEGMLPFEEKVARYLDQYDHHVLYRVTPVFTGNNLLADGVLMEAYSVEDDGAGVCFCVYVFNVQPGVGIAYATGDSWKDL